MPVIVHPPVAVVRGVSGIGSPGSASAGVYTVRSGCRPDAPHGSAPGHPRERMWLPSPKPRGGGGEQVGRCDGGIGDEGAVQSA